MAAHTGNCSCSTPYGCWKERCAPHNPLRFLGVKKFLGFYVQTLLTHDAGKNRLGVNAPKKILRPKTAEDFVQHTFIFNTRVELSSWNCRWGPPRAKSVYFKKPRREFKINKSARGAPNRPALCLPKECSVTSPILLTIFSSIWCSTLPGTWFADFCLTCWLFWTYLLS